MLVLAHGSINMRRYDTYIQVPDSIVFSFYVLLSRLHVRHVTSVSFNIVMPYFEHGDITIRGCVKYIRDPDMTLTFDLKVKFIAFKTWLCV